MFLHQHPRRKDPLALHHFQCMNDEIIIRKENSLVFTFFLYLLVYNNFQLQSNEMKRRKEERNGETEIFLPLTRHDNEPARNEFQCRMKHMRLMDSIFFSDAILTLTDFDFTLSFSLTKLLSFSVLRKS